MSNRLPLGACVRGPSAWILWQTTRVSLRSRLRQLAADPGVDPRIVAGFRNTIADLELAAGEFRDWERARSAADSAEVPVGGLAAGLERPLSWGTTGSAAEALACSPRWVTQLIAMGRVSATRVGPEWRVDLDSVEDFKLRGANAA